MAGHLDPTGLQYDGQHYFDPVTGNYVQPSPVGGLPEGPQGLNRYSLASGSYPAYLPSSGIGSARMGAWAESALINTGKSILGNRLVSPVWRGLSFIHQRNLVANFSHQVSYQSRLEGRVLNQTAESALGFGYLAVGRLRSMAPPGSWRASVLSGAEELLDVGLRRNTVWTTVWEKSIQAEIEFSMTPVGRAAGWLAYSKYGGRALELGLGVVIDVGWQAYTDYPLLMQGDLTWDQYGGRLGVAGFGSTLSWGAGLFFGGMALSAGAPVIVAGGVTFAVGVGVSILYDMYVDDWLNRELGFEPGTTPIWRKKL